MAKVSFQQPLLQLSVSYNSSEIILIRWFGAQKALLLSMLKNINLIFWWKFWNRNLCNIANLTFDQINASLPNKSIKKTFKQQCVCKICYII